MLMEAALNSAKSQHAIKVKRKASRNFRDVSSKTAAIASHRVKTNGFNPLLTVNELRGHRDSSLAIPIRVQKGTVKAMEMVNDPSTPVIREILKYINSA